MNSDIAGSDGKAGSAHGDEPWHRENPRDADEKPVQHLSPAQKAAAKRRAKKAGRPYPNLVDNMHVAQAAHASAKGR